MPAIPFDTDTSHTPPAPSLPLPALVAQLKQSCLDWPTYGLPFAAALDAALRHVECGAVIERVSFTAYYVRALPHAAPYRVTLGGCSCRYTSPWCWHRGLVHLGIAQGDSSIIALPEGGNHGA